MQVNQTAGCFSGKQKDGDIRVVLDCQCSKRCHRSVAMGSRVEGGRGGRESREVED